MVFFTPAYSPATVLLDFTWVMSFQALISFPTHSCQMHNASMLQHLNFLVDLVHNTTLCSAKDVRKLYSVMQNVIKFLHRKYFSTAQLPVFHQVMKCVLLLAKESVILLSLESLEGLLFSIKGVLGASLI